MDGPAIVMLVVGAVFLWGGLLLAALSYWRGSRRDPGGDDPSDQQGSASGTTGPATG